MTQRPYGILKSGAEAFPAQGNREMPVTLDFTNVATIIDDLYQEQNRSLIDFIQSIYIDNSLNASPFTITFNGIQKITAQPGSQGIYPVIVAGKISYVAQSTGGVQVPVIFSNTAKPYFVWGGSINTNAAIPQGTFTARSGFIALGGTSQSLMAANAARKRFIIQNPATGTGQNIAAAESLFINFGAAAGVNDGTSIELLPGGSIDSASGPVTTQQISVNAATTDHRYIAQEM